MFSVVVSESIYDRLRAIQELSTACGGFALVRSPGRLDELMACCRKLGYVDCCVLILESSVLFKDILTQPGELLRQNRSVRVLARVDSDETQILKHLATLGCFGFLTDGTTLSSVREILYATISGELSFPRRVVSEVLQTLLIEHTSDRLSRRECEILTLLRQKLSNKRIAERLFISQETLRWHLRNIYSKTRVHGRENLVRYANEVTELGPSGSLEIGLSESA